MKDLKFSGREAAVIRAIDFATGTSGGEILLRTRLDAPELLGILNTFLDIGYIETVPPRQDHIAELELDDTMFEPNPAYIHQMRKSLVRG